MTPDSHTGQIIILNGAPRSGKSTIAKAIQDEFDGAWMNLGVDTYVRYVTPERYKPGIGVICDTRTGPKSPPARRPDHTRSGHIAGDRSAGRRW